MLNVILAKLKDINDTKRILFGYYYSKSIRDQTEDNLQKMAKTINNYSTHNYMSDSLWNDIAELMQRYQGNPNLNNAKILKKRYTDFLFLKKINPFYKEGVK